MSQHAVKSLPPRFYVLAALIALLPLAGLAGAQVAPGFPSFVPQDCNEVDCVDLLNNNISLNVPIMSKAGAIKFGLSLNGSYYISLNAATTTWQPSQLLAAQFAPLTQASSYSGLDSSGYTYGAFGLCPDGVTRTTEYSGFYIVVAGTYHYLPAADFTDTTGCYHRTITDVTADNSGYSATFTLQGLVAAYDRSGDSIGFGTIADPNGNAITFSAPTYTDTLGVTVLTVGSGNFPHYTWTDANGNSPFVFFTTSSTVHLKSVFGCSGVSDYDVTGQTLPSLITFPDSTTLGLTYEGTPGYSGDYTGRLNQITLREGGTIAYTYGGSNNGFNCTYQTVSQLTRTTSDGTRTYTLAFSVISGSNWKETNTVINEGGNKKVYTFTGLTSSGNSSTYAQVLTQEQDYQNTGTVGTPAYTLQRTVVYCYNVGASPSSPGTTCPTAQVTFPVGTLATFTTLAGPSPVTAENYKVFDKYGNVAENDAYDFGLSSPTTTTTITMAVNGFGNCSGIGANIHDRPCSIVTQAGASTIASSKFAYDAYGNLLTKSVSKDGGTTFLSNPTANYYNPNGTIQKAYDFAGNLTSYAYNGSAGCNNVFPTSITYPNSAVAATLTWNCTGGVLMTSTDQNGALTSYCYNTATSCSGGSADPWWRVRSTTDPLGNQTFFTPTATSFESSFKFNSNNSIQNVITTTDGYGRPISTQKQQSPTATNYDTAITQYVFTGTAPAVVSVMPCSTTLGGNCSGSGVPASKFYDLIGRLTSIQDTNGKVDAITYSQNDVNTVVSPAPSGENTKATWSEVNGLGQPTKFCAVSSTASGNVTCGLGASGTTKGILTTISYTYALGSVTTKATRASEIRTTVADGIGRTTSKTTPEGGTWTYIYDLNTSCPSLYQGAAGQLASIADPNGNLICYQYDTSNRVTGINADGTACRHFYYDTNYGTVPTGVTTPTYAIGRLAEASTDNCSGTLSTDEWFSYDKDGHTTDQWESTPNSTQYYHSKATFTGPMITALQLASPSLYTLNFGLDGEGRSSSLKDGTTTEVSSTTFNAAGQTTNVAIGSGSDYDGYAYDAIGHLTHWTYQVNSVQETATLTWNTIGSLKSLAIIDGFNSGGTQTCSYNTNLVSGTGYDDLNRLIGVSCGTSGSIWNQAFSFNDPYDNLCKTSTGFVAWCPTYTSNPYTNQVVPSLGYSYDSNGNMKTDSVNTYTWNEFSKLKSVTGGGNLIYDAFGQTVEIDTSSTKTEIWYTQLGKMAFMNGTTENYAYWPTPGGGSILYNGTAYFMHKDWVGSARILSSVPSSGNGAVFADQAYAPYGEKYDIFGSTNQNNTMFGGGTTQDVVAGLYDTPNRELQGSLQGRFLSPDPAGAGWNQYAYPTNPNSEIDPLGLAAGGCGGDNGTRCGAPGTTGMCTDSFGASGPCSAMNGSSGCNASVDGVQVDCGSGLFGSDESNIPCPNGNCNVFGNYTGTNGRPYKFWPGVNGPVWIGPSGDELDSPPTEVGLGFASSFFNYSLGLGIGVSHVVYALVNQTPNPNPTGSKFVCNYIPVAGCATRCMPTTAHTFTENSCTNYANSTILWIKWGSSPAHYACIPSPNPVVPGTPVDGNLSCYDSPPQ